MAAVAGLPTRVAWRSRGRWVQIASRSWVANIDSATQTVFSGTTVVLQTAADAAGAPVRPLRTARRFGGIALPHSRGDRAPYGRAPRRTSPPSPTRVPDHKRGRAVVSAEAVFDDLAQAVAHPVQWYDATR